MADNSSFLAHQFDDPEQQYEASNLGMWVFLVTEIMFFGGLFAGYTVYRISYPAAFAEASGRLPMMLGAINTGVLICSSLTMALAVHMAQAGRRVGLIAFLLLTVVLGCAFLGIKGVEYAEKFHDNLKPGVNFIFEGPHANQAELFFSFYFAMTGMHAVHMVIGLGVLMVLVWMAWRGRFSSGYFAPVEITGLYWHFVDIIWIYLFPLLYLIGRST